MIKSEGTGGREQRGVDSYQLPVDRKYGTAGREKVAVRLQLPAKCTNLQAVFRFLLFSVNHQLLTVNYSFAVNCQP